MSIRLLIISFGAALALHAPRSGAQAPGPDNFIPNQAPKTGADAKGGEGRAVKYVLLLPGEKSSESVKEAERNPFGKSEDDSHNIGGKTSNEETKIQEQLSKLHATGLSPGPNGLRVMLGDIWISKNDILPPVVKDQTLALRVSDVTRDTVQFTWMEKKFTGLPPRMFNIQVNLQPTVRRVPYGQVPEKTEKAHESKASKMATVVEPRAQLASLTQPVEAEKKSQLAIAPTPPPKPGSSVAMETAGQVRNPADLPTPVTSSAGASIEAPALMGPPTPVSTPQGPANQERGKIVTGSEVPAAAKTATSARQEPPALAAGSETHAAKDPSSAVPPANDPASWKRAMGLMKNLVKLSEAGK